MTMDFLRVAQAWLSKPTARQIPEDLLQDLTGHQAVQELLLEQEARATVGRITGVGAYYQTAELTKPDIFQKKSELAEKLKDMTPDRVHQRIRKAASQRVRKIMDNSSRHH